MSNTMTQIQEAEKKAEELIKNADSQASTLVLEAQRTAQEKASSQIEKAREKNISLKKALEKKIAEQEAKSKADCVISANTLLDSTEKKIPAIVSRLVSLVKA